MSHFGYVWTKSSAGKQTEDQNQDMSGCNIVNIYSGNNGDNDATLCHLDEVGVWYPLNVKSLCVNSQTFNTPFPVGLYCFTWALTLNVALVSVDESLEVCLEVCLKKCSSETFLRTMTSLTHSQTRACVALHGAFIDVLVPEDKWDIYIRSTSSTNTSLAITSVLLSHYATPLSRVVSAKK